jgi:hypothetical protein
VEDKKGISRKEGGKGKRRNSENGAKDGYEVLLGESNCKVNGGISLSTKVERWSPSESCMPEVVAL